MDDRLILLCEDSTDGMFTAVYDGWSFQLHGKEVEIRTAGEYEPELFCSFRRIETDSEKAEKVASSVRKKLGIRVYEDICYVAASARAIDKGTVIFRLLWKALRSRPYRRDIMEELTDPWVIRALKIRIQVWHEFHRMLGFVRFRELSGEILYSEITPDNDVLALLGPHFENRFPNENWMICDKKRRKVLVHPRQKTSYLYYPVSGTQKNASELAQPEEYEELWKVFCRQITIHERKNPGLQGQMLPLKYRVNMTEFTESVQP